MLVAIVYNTTWYIYNFRRNLIKELQDKGHTVVAISPHDEFVSKLEELGVKHYDLQLEGLSKNPIKEFITVLRLGKIIKQIRPDYIFSYTIKCNIYTGLCRIFLPFAQLANVSGIGEVFDKKDFINKIVCRLYKLAFRKTECVFFQNKEDLEIFLSNRLAAKDRCHLLPGSGVDLKFFAPSLREDTKKRSFLMFGRLLPKKGFDLFLEAAKILKQKYGDSSEFMVMGVPDERRIESVKLFEKVQDYDKQGFVKLIPRSSDVRPILNSSDVVVLPSSYNEGVPRSLLEAMACGKALITTNWKGCRETVQPGVNGELIEINDLNDLVLKMEKYIQMSFIEVSEKGKASRSLAEKKFDEKTVLTAYLKQMAT